MDNGLDLGFRVQGPRFRAQDSWFRGPRIGV